MILTIVAQVLILPILMALASLYLTKRLNEHWKGHVLFWFPSLIWIAGVPSLPPKQGLDWLVMLVIAMVAVNYSPLNDKHRSLTIAALTIGTIAFISTPIMEYYYSHQTLIEILAITGLAVFIPLKLHDKPNTQPFVYLSFSLVTGIGGIATIATGSLLIGLVMIALACLLFTLDVGRALMKVEHLPNANIVAVVSLILLLIARLFTELPLPITISLVLGSLIVLKKGGQSKQ